MTDFYGELGKLRREVCDVCKEIGFNMRLQDGGTQAVCVRCRNAKLAMAEEMLIARADIEMEMSRVRGCQFKYKGHVISWMQNVPKLVHRLPSLPHELQVLIIKPTSIGRLSSEPSREYQRRFRVRRRHIEVWLQYLITHHPDYRSIEIHPIYHRGYVAATPNVPRRRPTSLSKLSFFRSFDHPSRCWHAFTVSPSHPPGY
ncbi:hypothetical protein N7G274_001695 [Stereocaulon virgatum]|uniref:DUF6570 domain-containing protein n=1 Tax=Stereocaulon virgatum TaxID=373712 RepID=A0ABR4AMA4_9LECA